MTTSTHYVIRQQKAPRAYYVGFHTWAPAIEQAEHFEFMSAAELYAVMQLGLTELDYTVELTAAITHNTSVR